ncbi:MAG: flagellar motor switch protein FliG [Armatimonadetes bacterium]|nr:flagellar motor switch protein FliG [Armatimonadota bacterium]
MTVRQAITGRQKAAMLIVALGTELASTIMKHLKDEEIEALTFEIANVPHVAPEDRQEVITEAYQIALAREAVTTGGAGYARQVLERSVGKQRASEILDRLSITMQVGPFDALRRVDPLQLASLLQQEHPQTIALVLAHLKPEQAAAVLAALPAALQVEVAIRVAVMDRTAPETIREVEAALETKLTSLPTQEYTSKGGVTALVEIINQSDRTTEKTILEALQTQSPDLADQVKKLMFVFEDLLSLDDRSIQLILRTVDSKDLSLAMKGASEELKAAIYRNMSQRAAEALKEDLQLMGPVRVRDVEEAQGRIVMAVRQLEESGQIIISRGGQEELIV